MIAKTVLQLVSSPSVLRFLLLGHFRVYIHSEFVVLVLIYPFHFQLGFSRIYWTRFLVFCHYHPHRVVWFALPEEYQHHRRLACGMHRGWCCGLHERLYNQKRTSNHFPMGENFQVACLPARDFTHACCLW